jgi:endogenous inhibitor of DNA gyrase (YacG/DUF329 family)
MPTMWSEILAQLPQQRLLLLRPLCGTRCAKYATTQGAARAAARSGRRCERCGEPIEAERSAKRFCSVRCRVAAFRALAAE